MKTSVFSCINHKQIMSMKILLIIIINAKMPYKVLVSPNQNIVVGNKKNRLIKTVLLSTQNKYLNCWVRFNSKVSFSGPMMYYLSVL